MQLIPTISQVSPQTIAVGSSGLTMTVVGTNFTSQTVILWNGAAVATTVVDGKTLSAPLPSGNFSVPGTAHVQVQNNQSGQSSQAVPVMIASSSTVTASLGISTTQLPSGTAGAAYSANLGATGGTPGYVWSITSGQLPAGLSLSATSGVISGTPVVSGTFSVGVTVVDSGAPQQQATASLTFGVVAPKAPTLVLGPSALPGGTATQAYTAGVSATGGTGPYTWSIGSGQLPAGLAISAATGVISGTPTTSSTFSFAVTVTDSGSPVQTATATTSIAIAASPMLLTTPALSIGVSGTAYAQSLQVSGGTPGYSWSVSAGGLPAGLALGASGLLSGTPTASGSFTFTATVSDSGSPVQTKSAVMTLVVAAPGMTITTAALANGINGTAYSQSLQVSGGTPGYSWSVSAGSLPAGLVLGANGLLSGTPAASGSFTFTVTVSDSGGPVQTKSAVMTLVVAAPALAITTGSLAGGTNGTAYSQTLQVSGGTPGYSWSVSAGTLPSGLVLGANGILSGTPAASGSFTFTATVSDSGSPVQKKSAVMTLVVAAPGLAITTGSLVGGTNGAAYSQTLQVSGGTPGYSWSVSAGVLPAGLTLASSGLVSGTPTASGTSSFTVMVSDSGSPVQTKSAVITLVISVKALTVATSSLAAGGKGAVYSQTLVASGGTPAYNWSVTSGSLPAGLSLVAATGVISGTPTGSGTSNFVVSVSDGGSPEQTATLSASIVIAPSALTMNAFVLPSGTNGTAYSQTLQASGGTPSYTWQISSGSLPAGVTLGGANGTISGTPTASGTFMFTAMVSDSGSPAQTKSANMTLVVAPGVLAIAAPALPSATMGTAYSSTVQTSGGTPGFTWAITSGSLPGGLTQAATTGVISGTPTASGTFNFTVKVSDSGSPVQTASASATLIVAAAPSGPATWYIRKDGGSATQCTGTTNAAYSGSGTGQACAFAHPFWLLNQSTWAWDIAKGDTVKFEDAGPYYMGLAFNGLGSNWNYCQGQNDACALPPMPNGVSFLGVSAGNCHNTGHSVLTNPTQLIGINNTFAVLDLQGSVGVDVECFDITQPEMCTRSGMGSIPSNLNCSNGTNNFVWLSGLVLSYLGSNGPSDSTVRDLQIHGLANEAVTGGKMNTAGTTMTFSDIYMYGNANTGWDGDAGGCSKNCESTGTINLSYINAYWSGCMEIKPNGGTVGGNGVTTCVDQAYNGNGDNIVMIATGGTWNWNHVITKWGAQDGVDLLHTGDDITSGVVINMNDVDSEGNEGQQWKVGGTVNGTNLRLIANCRRLQYPFAPNPANYNQYVGLTCRAFSGATLSVSPGHSITVTNSTIVGYANPFYDIDCYTNGPGCPANSYSVVLRDNLMMGYNDPVTTTRPAGLYWGTELSDPFLNQGSAISNMLWAPNTMRASSGQGPANGCSQTPTDETSAICSDPLLMGEIGADVTLLDNFNINLQPGSPAVGAGVSTGVTLDFNGTAPSTPGIGAIE